MANFFDKFDGDTAVADAPSGNFFDQFDAPSASITVQRPPALQPNFNSSGTVNEASPVSSPILSTIRKPSQAALKKQLRDLRDAEQPTTLGELPAALLTPSDETRARAAEQVATHTPEQIDLDSGVNLPTPTPQDITTLTGMRGRAANAVSTVAGIPSGLASGLVESGVVGAPEKVVSQLASGFVAQMAASVPESLVESVKHYSNGDNEKGDSALLNGLVTAGLLAIPAALAKKNPTLEEVAGKDKADALRQAVTITGKDLQTPKGALPPEPIKEVIPDATSTESNAARSPEREVRPPVGESPPLRQQGQAPEIQEQPRTQGGEPNVEVPPVGDVPEIDKAQTLEDLKALENPTPEQIAARDKLQAESDALKNSAGWGGFTKPAVASQEKPVDETQAKQPLTDETQKSPSTKEGSKNVPEPVEEPKAPAQSEKFRVGNNPTLHTLVEKLPQTESEIANGEQSVVVKNDKTGESQTVLETDLTPVTEKPLADKIAAKNKSDELDKQLRALKLDPSSFSNIAQKRAALKRAKAISEFPKAQISRAPGAAASGEPSTYSAIQQLADQLETTRNENAPVNEKVSAIEKAKVKASELKDGVKSTLANVLAIKNALWDSYSKLSPYTDMKRIVGKWFYAGQKADFEAREFGKQITKAIPDKTRREAITNWIQADGDMAVLKDRESASKPQYARGYKIAQNLTPREIEIAKMLREYYDRQLEKGISEGLLKEGLENYITQVWKKENPVTMKLMNELVNSKLQPNFKFARKRIFDSYFEGEQAGYKPTKDAGFLVANYDQSFNKSLAARAFVKDLHEGVASDGRPLVEVSGSGKMVDEGEAKPRFIIKPKATPEAIGDYKTIDHPALRGWKWVGKTPDGADVLLQGELKVHPEIYAKLKNRLSTSWFRQHPFPRSVLNLQGALKQSMMSISGFHQVQENLHALGHRINPLNLEKLDFSEPVTKSLVEHGLQLADYNALADFGEGLSSGHLINKIPFVGSKLQAYNDWLFQDNIPRLKLTMAKHALERNKERYADAIKSGKVTPDQVIELTASQANHAFGELPYKYWGRNPNLQDFYRTFLLAPDFLEARAGFVGQAAKPGGLGVKGLLKNEQIQALALLALSQYMIARITNQIVDDDPHWELKNAFRIISGNHAYSLRTVPGDIIHLMSDPRGFTFNRLSPIVGRGGIEAITGRDYRGVKRDFFDQMKDLLKSGIPISFSHKNGQSILESFANAFGIQNQRYDAVQNIQQKVQDFKTENKITTPYETVYNPDEDKYAALRNAVQEGNKAQAQKEFDKLKLIMPPSKIKEHFKDSLTRPLTGSAANDLKFYNGLNEVGKAEYKEAKDLRRARLNLVNSLNGGGINFTQ